jgi:hypothetical protein
MEPAILVVDRDAAVPGRQTTLRGAIQDANRYTGLPKNFVYAPRGTYQLSLALQGTGGDHQGDFDITRHVVIIGTGAGETVIDASPLRSPQSSFADRVFEVANFASLEIRDLTVTGGRAPAGSGTNQQHGGAILVRNAGLLTVEHSAIVDK